MRNLSKLIQLSLALFCITFQAHAQISPNAFGYYQDALRFSQYTQYGTARFMGLGGSGSTLGGDLSSTILNPAGLGFYNRNQVVITPSVTFNNYSTNYNGSNTESNETLAGLSGIGAAINFNKSDLIPGGWRGGTLGITYNRISDFKKVLDYGGFNNEESIIDAMLYDAFGLFPFQLGGIEQVGYDHYLINPFPDDQAVYTSFVEGFPYQSEYISRNGHMDQVNVSFGGNYDDKIYVGAGIGFISSRYSYNRIYNERFENSQLRMFDIDEQLRVSGNGVNANLGVIIRPSPYFRIGASITTPTWHTFSEEGDAIYTSEYNDYDVSNFLDENGNRIIEEDTILGTLQTQTDLFVSDFDLQTPFKYNLGSSVVIGKIGFITADVEFIDYSNAKISSIDFNPSADNETVSSIYQNTYNARLGAEIRLSVLRFRAGVARLGSPYSEALQSASDEAQMIYSLGFGVYSKGFFADLGLSQTSSESSFQSYSNIEGIGPSAFTETQSVQARLSIGFNF